MPLLAELFAPCLIRAIRAIRGRISLVAAPHEPPSKEQPPLPDPLLHKYVEEREMERHARVYGFNARIWPGKSFRVVEINCIDPR